MTLTKYILEHTNVFLVRNAHFFEYMYSNQLQWYKLHFPTNIYKAYYHLKNKKKLLVGEQTGTYYAHPDVPKRIREHLPNVKLIAMFRNPVKSTYSKYYHFYYDFLNVEHANAKSPNPKRFEYLKSGFPAFVSWRCSR